MGAAADCCEGNQGVPFTDENFDTETGVYECRSRKVELSAEKVVDLFQGEFLIMDLAGSVPR